MKISEKKFSFFPSLNQYFPIFHMRQVKTSLERKKKSVGHASLPCIFWWNLYRRYLSRLKCYSIQISATLSHLCWIDVLHTQNFEILTSLEKTQESKNFDFFFRIFFKTTRWAEILDSRVIWANLMFCILRILKFAILRVPA